MMALADYIFDASCVLRIARTTYASCPAIHHAFMLTHYLMGSLLTCIIQLLSLPCAFVFVFYVALYYICIINPLNLFCMRPNYTFKQLNKSVLTPSAHSITLCVSGPSNEKHFMVKLRDELFVKNVCQRDRAVILLMCRYGLRISEVLNIEQKNVLKNGKILINGLKHSQNRIIEVVDELYYWYGYGFHDLPLKLTYSRFYYYRLFLKLGYSKQYAGNEKKSVTHYFRHEFVKSFENESVEKADLSRLIGHKNNNNLKYYEK